MHELLPPLKFSPIIKPLPWGGRKLESMFHKVLPPGVPCGESWEVVDLPQDQSLVADGEWASASLSSLVESRREQLLGEVPLLGDRFPVLFKLIDARENLSVQVHPDEHACRRLGQGARPKTEAWYVLHADAGAKVYLGLLSGMDRGDLLAALHQGSVEEVLCPVQVRTGDFIYLPAGTLHAIGGGVLLAEIQQSSDTTYRLFDWNRMGLDGRPRLLQVEAALVSIHFEISGRPAHATPLSGRPGIRSRAFSIERLSLTPDGRTPLEAGRPRILCCIEGQGVVGDTGAREVMLRAGETCLVPACRAGHLFSQDGGTFLLTRV